MPVAGRRGRRGRLSKAQQSAIGVKNPSITVSDPLSTDSMNDNNLVRIAGEKTVKFFNVADDKVLDNNS